MTWLILRRDKGITISHLPDRHHMIKIAMLASVALESMSGVDEDLIVAARKRLRVMSRRSTGFLMPKTDFSPTPQGVFCGEATGGMSLDK